MKFIIAFLAGIAASFGLTYLALHLTGNKSLKNQVDVTAFNLFTAAKRKVNSWIETVRVMATAKPSNVRPFPSQEKAA